MYGGVAGFGGTLRGKQRMAALRGNRLVGDLPNSISLRVLCRAGACMDLGSLKNSFKTWRALQRAVARRDIDGVLQTAHKRIGNSREAAIRALSSGVEKGKGSSTGRSAVPAKSF